VVAGALIIGAGAFSAVGNVSVGRDFTYLMGESAGVHNIPQRTQHSLKDSIQSFGFLVETFLVGIPPILVGLLP
jgi:hypothetical protein